VPGVPGTLAHVGEVQALGFQGLKTDQQVVQERDLTLWAWNLQAFQVEELALALTRPWHLLAAQWAGRT
jgi:hypothetical protein